MESQYQILAPLHDVLREIVRDSDDAGHKRESLSILCML